ncbi:hypothetical protein P9112_008345 [Eukaryota sp. TZLM1-RC]
MNDETINLVARLQFPSSASVGKTLSSSIKKGRLSSTISTSLIPPKRRFSDSTNLPSNTPSSSKQSSHESLTSFISFLKANPDTIDFRYLINASTTTFNPYDLLIVPFSEVDPDNYYTISTKGITHFTPTTTEFVELNTWLRHRRIFSKLIQIPLFKKCSLWKSFHGWKKTVRRTKFSNAETKLSNSLFMMSPVFHKCLVSVQGQCEVIRNLDLTNVSSGDTFEIFQLGSRHKESVARVSDKLLEIFNFLTDLLKDVCDDVIDTLVKINREESITAGMLQTEKSSSQDPAKFSHNSNKKSVTINGGRALSYQEMATRRAECRRLMSFIRLVDYLVFDSLYTMTLRGIGKYAARLGFFSDVNIAKFSEMSSNEPFLVTQLVSDPQSKVIIQPQSNQFLDLFKEILDDFKNTITSYRSMVSHDHFISFFSQDLGISLGAPSPDHASTVLVSMIRDSFEYKQYVKVIRDSIHYIFGNLDKKSLEFHKFFDMMEENSKVDIHSVPQESLTLEYFSEELAKYRSQLTEIGEIPSQTVVCGVIINLEPFINSFIPSPSRCMEQIQEVLPNLARDKNQALINDLQETSRILRDNCGSVEEFIGFLDHIRITTENLEAFKSRFEEVRKFYHLIQDYSMKVDDIDLAVFRNLTAEYDDVINALDVAETKKEDGIDKFSKELEVLIKNLHSDVVEVCNTAQDPILSDPEANLNEVVIFVDDLYNQAKEIEARSKNYSRFAAELAVLENPEEYDDVLSMMDEVSLKHALWTSYREWTNITSHWLSVPFSSLDTDSMQQEVQNYFKSASKIERGLEKNVMASKFKKAVEVFKQSLPVVVDLRNEKLKLRHRQKIEQIFGLKFPSEEELTFDWLIQHGAVKHAPDINAVALEATNEANLEELIKQIEDGWTEVNLQLVNHRDSKELFIISTVEDIVTLLEDNQQLLSTMRGSRYVSAVESQVEEWEAKLNLFQETLDEWLECQRNWIYLENIFSAPDISKQLPEESKLFQKVDYSWREVMKQTRELPNALGLCSNPNLLQTFKKNNAALEKIQKALDNYLEKKRAAFPRFYFLSNDELLEILSQARNPEAVQPHLRKCFDGINKLSFTKDGSSSLITSMISAEGEEVPLPRIKARGEVCKWLMDVQSGMRESLRKIFRNAIAEYQEKSLEDWLLSTPAQIIIGVVQIFWCKEITEGLVNVSETSDMTSGEMLHQILKSNTNFLNQLSSVVQGNISELHRNAIVALITISVHNRDIVQDMIDEEVGSVNDFGWTKRLRYYWSSDHDTCEVRQTNTYFTYGYEYLGCTGRLVITPLTDKCYITLTSALHNKLGGAPAGPAGTGKTETVKDLAKALGRLCVVFNCSEQIDCLMMERLFAGLVQAGAWTCLDEFNRIGLEVLSVVAQQVLTIRSAILSESQTFEFGGCGRIPLNPNCGVFITMNPGYAGRTELPDNLQVLFRPVAMMVPDYALIAEVELYSLGFTRASILARKMVQLYKLSSEQLSKQDHYDFGMRAVKTALRAAGSLRQKSPELGEEVLVYKALYVENSPKFTAQDLSLFKGILSDLFPGIEVEDLNNVIIEAVMSVFNS